jgi:glyoxylase-like metal-dependent hydrolase (beta-lactamase superfamily II)
MSMEQVVSGVHMFTGLMVGRVYLLEGDDGLTLIDASIPPAANKILQQLQAAGHQPGDVKRILITHAHPDHVGALPKLCAETGAQVWASAVEQPVIKGKTSITRAPARIRP